MIWVFQVLAVVESLRTYLWSDAFEGAGDVGETWLGKEVSGSGKGFLFTSLYFLIHTSNDREVRLRWFGRVERGRPKRRFIEAVREGMFVMGVTEE